LIVIQENGRVRALEMLFEIDAPKLLAADDDTIIDK